MAASVTLPTGERISPFTLLAGEPEWNDAVSVMTQLIPACIAFHWSATLARSVIDIGQDSDAGRRAIEPLLPLASAALPRNTLPFLRDMLTLCDGAAAVLVARLERQREADLGEINESLAAFGALGALTAAASPIFSSMGLVLPDLPELAAVETPSEVQARIDALNDYLGLIRSIREALP